MNANCLKWLGFGGLLLILAAFGWFMVPAHTVSIWMDPEFTDWISPIANRLHGGVRLYTDGMHSPMPPIPYVTVRMLYPQGAIWINESLLNYLFVSATILLLFLEFARKSGPALSFAACAITIPIFFQLSKTILYDSMAQFLVVVTASFCLRLVEALDPRANACRSRKLLWCLLTGAASGVLLLTKQNTGLGVVAAVIAVLVLLPVGVLSLNDRCRNIFIFLTVAVIVFFGVAAALSKYISVSGMLHDVFIAGSEPKGGNQRIFANLQFYALAIAHRIAIIVPIIWAALVILRRKLSWRTQLTDFEGILNSTIASRDMPLRAQEIAMFGTMLLTVICGSAAIWLPDSVTGTLLFSITYPEQIRPYLLNFGLVACILLITLTIFKAFRGSKAHDHPFAPLVIVFFCAALFHNLSVTGLRWTYDNNPLIGQALLFLLGPIIGGFHHPVRRPGIRTAVRIALFSAIVFYMWTIFIPQLKLILACTESWPEIPHLAGARLRPECNDLRQMVRLAQAHADKDKHETVLLLPGDPNIEAWIDRDRPALSSSILFTDQYWDRYVDSDFASLQRNPPKIIIIGPRNYWRLFSQNWHKNTGAIRLIRSVQNELLPAHYKLLKAQPISFQERREFMDVYVRSDP